MAVHLVRHASAGSRDPWDAADADRALDETGLIQAASLATLLSAAPITRIASSPALRCIQTVTPLATDHGLEVHRHDHLFEGTDIEAAWECLIDAANLQCDAVLCSHGDVIPTLIRRLHLRGMRLPGGSGCAKGSCWTLEGWDGTRFLDGTYRPPGELRPR
ncbi:MAG: histidine phosphatase family protein [Microthrixaceae bacterium]|nr:histidine phosphatase family protein [Microthrixaceae bacterium]